MPSFECQCVGGCMVCQGPNGSSEIPSETQSFTLIYKKKKKNICASCLYFSSLDADLMKNQSQLN